MSGKAILIADDDHEDVETLQWILGEAKVLNQVHAVSDGDEAIAYLSGSGKYSDRDAYPYPALLLLDVLMPQKTGLEVLRWIRSRPEPEHQHLGVVIMTGMKNIEAVNLAYSLGARSFLLKSLMRESLEMLLDTVPGVCRRSDEGDRSVNVDTKAIP